MKCRTRYSSGSGIDIDLNDQKRIGQTRGDRDREIDRSNIAGIRTSGDIEPSCAGDKRSGGRGWGDRGSVGWGRGISWDRTMARKRINGIVVGAKSCGPKGREHAVVDRCANDRQRLGIGSPGIVRYCRSGTPGTGEIKSQPKGAGRKRRWWKSETIPTCRHWELGRLRDQSSGRPAAVTIDPQNSGNRTACYGRDVDGHAGHGGPGRKSELGAVRVIHQIPAICPSNGRLTK